LKKSEKSFVHKMLTNKMCKNPPII
jgi:hypothetical protein